MFRSKILLQLLESESKPSMKLAMHSSKQDFCFSAMLKLLKKSDDSFDLVLSGSKYLY
jgi:hypothetical protein